MWSQNRVTERLNIEYPIFLAPMAELVTPELAAEISNAGGLGALGMWGFTLEEGVKRIEQFRKLSNGSLNINYPLWDGESFPAGRNGSFSACRNSII